MPVKPEKEGGLATPPQRKKAIKKRARKKEARS
jgi:hypothetical protein